MRQNTIPAIVDFVEELVDTLSGSDGDLPRSFIYQDESLHSPARQQAITEAYSTLATRCK
jgi:hypothetical protein